KFSRRERFIDDCRPLNPWRPFTIPLTRILHIAPQLPPVIDGVGDFALGLPRRLESLTGLPNAVLAATALRLPGELQRRVEEHSCELILLHYSGYGYDPLGVPRLLLREIEDLVRT